MCYKQICWTCTHACNRIECVWVETLDKEVATKKQGCMFNDKGYMIKCNNYEKEQLDRFIPIKLKALALGISTKKYFRYLQEIKEFKLNISPEELHKLNLQLKDEKQQTRERKQQAKQELKQWQEDRALQKEIDKLEAKQLKMTYKRYLELKATAIQQGISVKQYLDKNKQEKKGRKPNLAEEYGISIAYFYQLKSLARRLNKEVKEVLEERKRKQEEREQREQQTKTKKEKQKRETAQDIANKLGVTQQYIYAVRMEIKRNALNISVEEFIKQKRESVKLQRSQILKDYHARTKTHPTQREKAEKLGIKLQSYKDICKIIKRKGLQISPEEYYKQKQEKKKNKNLTK